MCILEHFGEDLPVPDGVVIRARLLRWRRLVGSLRCKEGRDGCLPVAVRPGVLAEGLQRRRRGARRPAVTKKEKRLRSREEETARRRRQKPVVVDW